MVTRVEVPVETVRVEQIEKIIEKMVEVEKLVYVEKKAEDDCECISEVDFVQLWNKMMMIKFQDNKISEDCVSKHKFIDFIASNVQRNSARILKEMPPPDKNVITDL